MANRSDYQRAVLPRQIKKFLTLGKFKDEHEYGEMKRMFIAAHDLNRNAKNRRSALSMPETEDE